MSKKKKLLAIIPARSGSKGLPDKNIKLLAGKPLLAHSIDAALQSGVCDDVVVSTDSQRYAQIAQKHGAWVPFLRLLENATDKASSFSVIKEVLQGLFAMGHEYEAVILLQPTSPLRTGEDISKAFSFYRQKRADAVVGVCEAEHSPLWSNTLDETLSLDDFIPERALQRRQDIEKYYRVNGAIYIASVDFINTQERESFFEKNCYAYVMPKKRSVDIDDEDDFFYAEFLYTR